MIFGKVGRLGHGKTMRAVVDSLELAQLRGAVYAANIRVRVPAGMRFVQLPMDGFAAALSSLIQDLMACGVCVVSDDWGEVEHGGAGCEREGLVLLVDEMPMVWDAHGWAEMTKADRMLLTESRKLGIDVYWTAQFVDQVEKSIRNVTEEVELLRAYPPPSLARRQKGKRPWTLRSLRYRPGSLRELTAEPDRDKRLGAGWHRYKREHEVLYRTDELVRPATKLEPNARCKNDCCRAIREVCLSPCCASSLAILSAGVQGPSAAFSPLESGAAGRATRAPLRGESGEVVAERDDTPGERRKGRPVVLSAVMGATRAQDALAPEHAARSTRSAWAPLRPLAAAGTAPGGRSPRAPILGGE